MNASSNHTFSLVALTAFLTAAAVTSGEAGGFSLSLGKTHSTSHGSQAFRISVGHGSTGFSFRGSGCGSPQGHGGCRYVYHRTWVPARWEYRCERRPVCGPCGRSYTYVRVRHYVPGHYNSVRVHDPHCHCRGGISGSRQGLHHGSGQGHHR